MESKGGAIGVVIISILIIIATFAGLNWYYHNTASGQRALTDQRSDFANGMERTITVYTADGNVGKSEVSLNYAISAKPD